MEPNKTYELELNKQYKITLGDMSHCGLSHEEMIEHYKSNSSPLSFLLEKLLPKHFTNLVYDPTPQDISLVSGKTIRIKPDLRDKETNTTLYDQKAFNQKGGSFTRSSMKGIGRSFDQEEHDAWANAQTFIWTDFCDLPEITIIALSGMECLKRFPKGRIKFSQRNELFK